MVYNKNIFRSVSS